MIGLTNKRAQQLATAEKKIYSDVADKLDHLMLSLHMNLPSLSIANIARDVDGIIDEFVQMRVPSQPVKNVVDNACGRLSTLRGSLNSKMGAVSLVKSFTVAFVTIFEGVANETRDKEVLGRYQQMCKQLGDELIAETERVAKETVRLKRVA